MNDAWGRSLQARSPLPAMMAAAGGVLLGAASARSWLPLAGLMGAGALVWLTFAPVSLALGGVLFVRGLTDDYANVTIAAGLNPGSLLGLLVMGVAALRLLETENPRGIVVAVGTMLTFGIWSLLAIDRYGMNVLFIEEFVRTGSVVAVGLIAANPGKTFSTSQIASGVVLASVIPALLVISEAGMNWGDFVSGGLRPRGTISHPNAAAIFFSITLVMALWKRLYDGGGFRYVIMATLLLLAILITKSIGGMMQTLVALTMFVSLQRGNANQRAFIVAVVVGVLVMFVTDPFGLSRVSDLEALGQEGGDSSATWRIANWTAFLEIWRDEPLLGFGLGSTVEHITPLGRQAHNEVIRLLVETGAIGLSLIITAYAFLLGALYRLSRSGPHTSFAAATLAVVMGLTAHALATDALDNTGPMYLVAALIGTTLAAVPQSDSRSEEPSMPEPQAIP